MVTVRASGEAWLAVPPARAVILRERAAAEGRLMTPLGTMSWRCFDICRGCASYSAYRDIHIDTYTCILLPIYGQSVRR